MHFHRRHQNAPTADKTFQTLVQLVSDRRESLKEDPRLGQHQLVFTDDLVNKVDQIIHANRRLTRKDTSEEVNVNFSSVLTIITEKMSYGNSVQSGCHTNFQSEVVSRGIVFAVSVPILGRTNNVLDSVFAGGESWCQHY
ncbi:hypothetical protein CEXT_453331 [Caerostris extrusa]|uniref:Uncharacterized protein n=1 Tax=Caerostris extrusa TaxID=172846 RepID=A0AAV4TV97_CAEEX|nr:hypothetical protein CEXT_453331 [Caerostris extrusa]